MKIYTIITILNKILFSSFSFSCQSETRIIQLAEDNWYSWNIHEFNSKILYLILYLILPSTSRVRVLAIGCLVGAKSCNWT